MKKLVKIMLVVLFVLLAALAIILIFRIRAVDSDEKRAEKAPPVKTEAGTLEEEQNPPEDEGKEIPEQSAETPDAGDTRGQSAPPASADTDIQALAGRLEQLVGSEYSAGGNVAVCAGKTDGAEFASAGGGAMQAASLIKLYVAGAVYENYGIVSGQESYGGETESLLKSMITVSDNAACNTLVTRLGSGSAASGMSLVNQYCADHGFPDTHMGRLMLQSNDMDDNYTSVQDCCNFLKMADSRQLQGSGEILSLMNQQQRRTKIPAGIPSGVTVGNKTGELADVENDAAIVYAPDGNYVICVMSENLANPGAARQFITRVSGVVYEILQ